MTTIHPNQATLLRALVGADVHFILLGGVAAQVYGWTGATADVDITVAIDDSNTVRINRALAAVGAGPPQIGGLGTSFTTVHGRLEFVRRADGIGLFDDWARNARRCTIDDFELLVAAPDDLLRSKEAAGRQKDLDVLPQMRRDFIDAGALNEGEARGEIAPRKQSGS